MEILAKNGRSVVMQLSKVSAMHNTAYVGPVQQLLLKTLSFFHVCVLNVAMSAAGCILFCTASLKPQVISAGAKDSLGYQLLYSLQLFCKQFYAFFPYTLDTFFLSIFSIIYFHISKHEISVSVSLTSSSRLAFWFLGSSRMIFI